MPIICWLVVCVFGSLSTKLIGPHTNWLVKLFQERGRDCTITRLKSTSFSNAKPSENIIWPSWSQSFLSFARCSTILEPSVALSSKMVCSKSVYTRQSWDSNCERKFSHISCAVWHPWVFNFSSSSVQLSIRILAKPLFQRQFLAPTGSTFGSGPGTVPSMYSMTSLISNRFHMDWDQEIQLFFLLSSLAEDILIIVISPTLWIVGATTWLCASTNPCDAEGCVI